MPLDFQEGLIIATICAALAGATARGVMALWESRMERIEHRLNLTMRICFWNLSKEKQDQFIHDNPSTYHKIIEGQNGDR